jgi:putative Ca2+/H+ antiporter (TMEM165/GDT1 family)
MPAQTTATSSALSVFFSAAAVVVFAELGCLARTSVLAMKFGRPWWVFAGTMAGTALTMSLAVFIGSQVQHWISETHLRWVTGGFFVLFGLAVLAGKLHG